MFLLIFDATFIHLKKKSKCVTCLGLNKNLMANFSQKKCSFMKGVGLVQLATNNQINSSV